MFQIATEEDKKKLEFAVKEYFDAELIEGAAKKTKSNIKSDICKALGTKPVDFDLLIKFLKNEAKVTEEQDRIGEISELAATLEIPFNEEKDDDIAE